MSEQKEVKLHTTMDAKVWTEEFMRISPDSKDDGTMFGWFANAIMCGWDHAHWKLQPKIDSQSQLLAEKDADLKFAQSNLEAATKNTAFLNKRIAELENAVAIFAEADAEAARKDAEIQRLMGLLTRAMKYHEGPATGDIHWFTEARHALNGEVKHD